jgi:hypothetical protein
MKSLFFLSLTFALVSAGAAGCGKGASDTGKSNPPGPAAKGEIDIVEPKDGEAIKIAKDTEKKIEVKVTRKNYKHDLFIKAKVKGDGVKEVSVKEEEVEIDSKVTSAKFTLVAGKNASGTGELSIRVTGDPNIEEKIKLKLSVE